MKTLGIKSFMSPSMEELFGASKNRLPEAGFGAYDRYLKAFADETWVYACVKRIAQDIAASPLVLFNGDDEIIDDHPALNLLYIPNVRMSFYDLLYWMQVSLDCTGNGYWLFDEIDGRGMPHSIWPLIPSVVEIVPDPDPRKFIKKYKIHAGGKITEYNPSQIFQMRYHNPKDYYYGLPPLSAARMSVDSHTAATRYNLRFFDNAARPDVVFSTPNSLTPENRARMKEAFYQDHRGEENAHRAAFLEKGTTVEVVGITQKDMDFVEQKKMSREEICSVYGVPPSMVGLFEYSNYANAEAQEKMYWHSTLIPMLEYYASNLNRFFLPLFDPSGLLYFGIDRSKIKAVQEDLTKLVEAGQKLWLMGVPFNVISRALSLPIGDVPGGDIAYIPFSAIAVGSTPEETPPTAAAPEEGAKVKRPRTFTLAQMRAKHHRFVLLAENLGNPYKKAVAGFFDQQKDFLTNSLRTFQGQTPTLTGLGWNKDKENDRLKDIMRPHLTKSLLAGVESENMAIEVLLGKRVGHVETKDMQARVRKWVEQGAFRWSDEINTTTRKALDRLLNDEINEGSGIEEISGKVAAFFDEQKDYRSLRIAQTEIIAALNQGAIEAYKENDQIESKGWLATLDEATRPSHMQANQDYSEAGAIPVNENFNVGAGVGPSPGQLGAPEEDINCRCTIFPVIKKV